MYSLEFLSVLLLVASCSAQGSIVKITLYYDTLSPLCQEFIKNELFPGYQQVGNSVDLDLVPFGNVIAGSSNVNDWQCQHGPSECYLNKATACAINSADAIDQERMLKFVYTLAAAAASGNNNITLDEAEVLAKKSAEDSLLSWHEIFTCLHDGSADELFGKYNERQQGLNPKLVGVPTIWVDDAYDERLEADAITNFVALVCNVLRYDKPSACNAE